MSTRRTCDADGGRREVIDYACGDKSAGARVRRSGPKGAKLESEPVKVKGEVDLTRELVEQATALAREVEELRSLMRDMNVK